MSSPASLDPPLTRGVRRASRLTTVGPVSRRGARAARPPRPGTRPRPLAARLCPCIRETAFVARPFLVTMTGSDHEVRDTACLMAQRRRVALAAVPRRSARDSQRGSNSAAADIAPGSRRMSRIHVLATCLRAVFRSYCPPVARTNCRRAGPVIDRLSISMNTVAAAAGRIIQCHRRLDLIRG